MKKIRFKFLEEMDNMAFYKIELPKDIDTDGCSLVVSLNDKESNPINTTAFRNMKSKEGTILDGIKNREYLFIANDCLYIYFNNFISIATSEVCSSFLGKTPEAKKEYLEEYIQGLTVDVIIVNQLLILDTVPTIDILKKETYTLDKFFLPIRVIFKESYSPKNRIKLDTFKKEQLVEWLMSYSYILNNILKDNSLIDVMTTKEKMFDVQHLEIDDRYDDKYILVLEDGGEYGGPCSNNIAKTYLTIPYKNATDKDINRNVFIVLEASVDGFGISPCLSAVLSMYHDITLNDILRKLEVESFNLKNKKITVGNAFKKQYTKITIDI